MYKDPEQQRAAERRWYQANKATVAAKKDRKRARLRQLVREAKGRPCVRTWRRMQAELRDEPKPRAGGRAAPTLAIEGELRFDA
jgi:hypothetical protein